MISEQDNAPEEVKIRVRQMTKAIRYKARKEGGNLFKAFNDYMGSQSGISATERASVKQSLGLSETYSAWRDDLREVVDVPEKDTDADKVIKEKKVKNKIVINPPMKEAFEEIGATVIEAVELEEMDNADEAESQKKKQLQVKGQMLKKQQMLDRMRLQMQKQGKLPTGHAEGYAPGDVDQKLGAVTAIPKKDQDDAKARILAKAAAKRKANEEFEKLDEISQKTATKAFARRATDEFESDSENPRDFTKSGKSKADATKRRIEKKYGKKAGKHAERAAHATTFGRKSFSMPKVDEEVEVDEAMRPGERQRKVAAKMHNPYTSSKTRTVAHNVAVRGDVSTGDPAIKSRGGGGVKKDKGMGYGDRGAGNKARRRAGQEPLRGTRMKEETEDSLRDRRMERGGVDGNNRYNKAPGKPNTFGKKPGQKYDGMSALEKVKAIIRAKHGQGAIMDTKKKKK